MTNEIILEMMDRRSFPALLTTPFSPKDNKVCLTLPEQAKARAFPLSEISCLRMKTRPEWAPAKHAAAQLEEVETVAGTTYFVRVPENQQFQTGFFAFSIEEKDEFRFLFFSFVGTRSRKLFSQLGEILEKSGTVSKENINKALAEQKRLQSQRLGEILTEQQGIPKQEIDQTIQRMLQKKVHARAKIGDILVSAKLVTREQIDQTLAFQKNNKKKPLGSMLIEQGLVSEHQILVALSSKFHLEYIDIRDLHPSERAISAISPAIVKQLQIIPLEDKGDHLVVAMSDPANHAALSDTLRFHANRRIELVTALSTDIAAKINNFYHQAEDHVDDIIDEISEDEVALEEEDDFSVTEADSKLIRILNKILIDGYKKNASDIHIEPGSGRAPVKVRYRIDGICNLGHTIPKMYGKAMVSRIKVMANLDIAEHRRPQSGKIIIRYANKKIEFRVEITPTVGGLEDAVLRVLSGSKPLDLNSMDFTPQNYTFFNNIIQKPYGLILCVGPTGSGKTTTLHSALAHINLPDRKIWTAEDPVEITQPGLRQVQINTKIGLTFEEALRSFLRADPDVIMIGEMRDRVTAKIAVESSLTGHLVFSTLHTNTATETIIRLVEMGLEPFHFADIFLGVLAQRLTLRLCEHCKESYHPDKEEYDTIVAAYGAELYKKDKLPEYKENLFLMRENGCEKCDDKGFRGRIAIHELLIGCTEVKNAIRNRADADELKKIAIDDGMRTLTMDGIYKMLAGQTNMNQVNRVVVDN